MGRTAFGAVAVAVALAALALPGAAAACAVCAGGGEESRSAFIWTTVMLSVLPPAMVGGLVWWLWRLHRQRDRHARSLGKEELADSVSG